MPDISVVMATYNGGRFLDIQLESLAAQTHRPAELIVSDDGSSDDSIARAEAFARRAGFPVTVQRNVDRKGYRSNFMEAAKLAKSEIVCFCDQDDVWRADKLERVSAAFEDDQVSLVFHNSRVVDRAGAEIGMLWGEGAFPTMASPRSSDPWFFPPGFAECFRRDLMRFSDLQPATPDFNAPNQVIAHDQWVFFVAGVFGKIAYIDEPLVDYRQHGGNVYGMDHLPKGLRGRLGVILRVDSTAFSRRAGFASSMAAYLRGVAQDPNEDQRSQEHAAAGASRYERLAHTFDTRARIYRSQSLFARAGAWTELVGQARRDGEPSQLGKSIVRDAVLGVLRLGRSASGDSATHP